MTDQELNDFLPELKLIWDTLVRRDALPPRADAILIGGCQDLGLAEKAAELFHAGIARAIITTGYQPETLDITEARLLADRCIKLGVPSDAIILESSACNTGENIRLSAEIIGKVASIILVHKPYMSLRFLATAEAQWPNPQPRLYTTCQDISFEDYYKIHGLHNVAYKMLGDMKRMDDYVSKGYQTRQMISDEAQEAYQRLMSTGFVSR